MEYPNYSVLMSVYAKEKPEYLRESMESMFQQTAPTNDFVLVCDGPLTDELNAVISEEKKAHPEVLNVIRLNQNVGLGNALNYGIKKCKNELVARMDSDDISRKHRCEKQLDYMTLHPDCAIISGTVEEFSDSIDNIQSKRALPEKHEEICNFAKRRNPFNHPCVMYRKSSVEIAGGYQDFYLLEDYYLWLRMIEKGAKGYNLQEPLVWMRAGKEMYLRRSGLKYFFSQRKLFIYMKNNGFISSTNYLFQLFFRLMASIIPNKVRVIIYQLLLRSSQ